VAAWRFNDWFHENGVRVVVDGEENVVHARLDGWERTVRSECTSATSFMDGRETLVVVCCPYRTWGNRRQETLRRSSLGHFMRLRPWTRCVEVAFEVASIVVDTWPERQRRVRRSWVGCLCWQYLRQEIVGDHMEACKEGDQVSLRRD
jgi:hypothetical protein